MIQEGPMSISGKSLNEKKKKKKKKCFECAFDNTYFCQLILLFSLFLLLFIGLNAFFDTIHESHYTISTNFYLYL